MQKNIFRKSLVVGIIILFIGASIIIIPNIFVKTVKADITSGLVGYWNFNEGTGIIVHDSSGNGNDGEIVGDTQWVNGVEGTGLLLDGDDIVAIPDNSVLNPSQITLCCWVKLNRLAYGNGYQWNQSQMFICKGGDGTSGNYLLCQCGDTPESVFMGFQIGPWQNGNYLEAYFPLETDHWYFVTGTYDGDIMKIYLDGVILLSKDVGNISVGNGSPLYFGYNDASGYPYYLDGVLDEERVYNKALSEEEIWLLYSQQQNVPPIASFTYTPSDPKTNEIVTFSAIASNDTDGFLTLYEWDWNNDGIYEESYATSTATHSWSQAGSYSVTLRVTDNGGVTNTKTLSVSMTSEGGGGTTKKGTPGFELVFVLGAIAAAMLLWKKKRIT